MVASLIPSAMLTALFIMSLMDIGLNQMSLASLIIALGMLVDNAIVMSESIMVQMAAGKPAVEAAVGSARELRVPLLTSSLTTAAAFLADLPGRVDRWRVHQPALYGGDHHATLLMGFWP